MPRKKRTNGDPAPVKRHSGIVSKMGDPGRDDGGWLTPTDIAQMIGMHRSSVFAMIKRGDFKHVTKVRNREFVLRREIEEKFGVVIGKSAASA